MNIETSLMNATKQTIALDSYPGYPTTRLVIEDLTDDTNLTLPEGPWSASVNTLPDYEEQDRLKANGYELDDLGRPIHPWLREMITDPNVGVVTGLGEYWQWGPNRTADPVVINNDPIPKILLIKRGDTGVWALPGGFIDGDEPADTAAKRELLEETGLLLVGSEGHRVYDGVVADLRTTAHAWAETTALAWKVEGTPAVRAGDDANDAAWFTVDELPDQLHGSHAVLIQKALESADKITDQHHTIPLPMEVASYTYADGGHMAYHHLHATTHTGQTVFIKSHDKQAFTDPIREAHSRQYLHKEMKMYNHIRTYNFTAIPENVALLDGHTLIMDAMSKEDGWHWQAPETEIDRYMENVLQSVSSLQDVSLPQDFHDTMLPTFDTHKKEGWESINNADILMIKDKLEQWHDQMRPELKVQIARIVSELPQLQAEFSSLSDPSEFVLTHHDFRQANIAWHSEKGTKIVDWSWAGIGRKNSDATTLLIDLHKSGYDVSRHMAYFNAEHALTLIGFWLAHSIWPTRDGSDTVRFHQAVSAISAYDLLDRYRTSGDSTQSQPRPKN